MTRCELAAATTTPWRRSGSLRGANDEPLLTHKNSVRKKKRKEKEIIYVVWYMHYQENTIVLGTTELQCLGEIRGRVRSRVWQRPTGEFHWCKAVDSNCSYYQPNMADTEKGKIDFLLYLLLCCTFQNITYGRINPPTWSIIQHLIYWPVSLQLDEIWG